MDEMEEKLGNILNNPQMMQQIMSMAQAMGGKQEPPAPRQDAPPPRQDNPFANIDFSAIQKLSGLAQSSNIDKRERTLLQALGAYLSKERIGKLEKAMRAAKLAKIASSTLAQQSNPPSTGR